MTTKYVALSIAVRKTQNTSVYWLFKEKPGRSTQLRIRQFTSRDDKHKNNATLQQILISKSQ